MPPLTVSQSLNVSSLVAFIRVFLRATSVELEGDEGMTPDDALKSAREAGEYLIPKGIQPVYSLHWRTTGANRRQEPVYSLPLFLRINETLAQLRRKHNMPMNKSFLSKRGAYMQLEPDYDEGQW